MCSYTFTLSDSTMNPERLTNDRVGKNAEVGTSVRYQGIPYYMNQMNTWIRTFAQKFNDTLKSGYNTYGDFGCNLLTGDMAASEEQYNFVDEFRYDTFTYEAYTERVTQLMQGGMSQADAEKAAGIKVTDSSDSYYRLTAMNFTVSNAVELDPDLLSHRYEQTDGVEQDVLLDDLKRIATDTEKMSFRGGSASEFLQCILGDVALNASRANTFQKNFSDISEIINTQRLSISGVDEDEEAVNLVKYEHAYGLSSKMIQVLTEVYDRLILETGV